MLDEQERLQDDQIRLQDKKVRLLYEQVRLQDNQYRLQDEQNRLKDEQDRLHDEQDRHTVRTVDAYLHQGEHIPKMQNDIGRKSKLRVLRQRRSKDAGGCWLPCRAVPGRVARRSARRRVLDSCHRFTLDQMLAAAKTPGGLEPPSFVTIILYSTYCATLTL